jgi:hypothetical protein
MPDEALFQPSDHDATSTTLLRAQADQKGPQGSQQELRGSLFIVNRGPRGFGYIICPLCHAAEAAIKPLSIKWSQHKDPMSGKGCAYSNQIYPSDLVHRFDTDVLIVRISRPLPPGGPEYESVAMYRECCARTLAEALRFAAAHLLSIQASELRATYRMRNSAVDVILYDAVAGGAGYCARLNERIAMTALLREVSAQLSCPRDCANACTACLCDYSNQHSWDQFLRRPVKEWVEQINQGTVPGELSKYGAVLWKDPSSAALQRRIAELKEYHIFVPRINDGLPLDDVNDDTLHWIVTSLTDGHRVSIHTEQDLGGSPERMPEALRRALRYLEPWLSDGTLRIGKVSSPQNVDQFEFPRVFSTTADGPVWYTLDPLTPLLQSLLPKPAFTGINQAHATLRIQELDDRTVWYSALDLRSKLPIERYAFPSGSPHELDAVFAAVEGCYVEKLVIMDPFCAVQSASLCEFVHFIKSKVERLSRLEVHCRELHAQDKKYETVTQIFARTTELLKGLAPRVDVCVASFQKHRHFHDRSIEFKIIAKDGTSTSQHYDLSGGIDYLMDSRFPTTIYRYTNSI